MKIWNLNLICFILLLCFESLFANSTPNCKEKFKSGSRIRLGVDSEKDLRFLPGEEGGRLSKSLAQFMTAAAAPFWLSEMSAVVKEVLVDTSDRNLFDRFLSVLNISYTAAGPGLSGIPSSGPLVVVANHPRFGVDGLAIGSLISQVRPDVKIVMNEMMKVIPGFSELAIGVDLRNGSNWRSSREVLNWLEQGHVVVIFPAGKVSSRQLANGTYEDGEWNTSAFRMADLKNAPILPMRVEYYTPGRSFQVLHHILPLAEKSTYPQEILRQRNSSIRLDVGAVVEVKDLTGSFTAKEEISRIRSSILAPVPSVLN